MSNNEIFEHMRENLPPVFAATELDRLTGGAVRWATIQNLRSNKNLQEGKKPPKTCFRNDGTRKIIIIRDEFLRWWCSRLT